MKDSVQNASNTERIPLCEPIHPVPCMDLMITVAWQFPFSSDMSSKDSIVQYSFIHVLSCINSFTGVNVSHLFPYNAIVYENQLRQSYFITASPCSLLPVVHSVQLHV
jgi:hypothetical protein